MTWTTGDEDETDWAFAAAIRDMATRVGGSEQEMNESLHLFLVEWGYACQWLKNETPDDLDHQARPLPPAKVQSEEYQVDLIPSTALLNL